MSFLGERISPKPDPKPAIQVQVAEEEPHSFYLNRDAKQQAESPLPSSDSLRNLVDVGIFKDTLAPSFALHGGLAVLAWGVGRATDRVEAKDWLWPAAPVINAWWSAIGSRVLLSNVPLNRAFSSISWVERLLLTGVTLWGTRTFYRIATRSVKRGKDDGRYDAMKQQDGFWKTSLLTQFLPEAAIQTLISLPFTAPFRHQGAVLSGYHPVLQGVAVAMFSSGFALEALADYQLDEHVEKKNEGGLLRDGVWSLCRHPNYLGDALIHFSFPLLLYSSDMLAPIELLAPLANYVFLRYMGGDRQTEQYQAEEYEKDDPVKKGHLEAYQEQKNSFWPGINEAKNQWAWIVVGAGAAGVALERGFNALHHL